MYELPFERQVQRQARPKAIFGQLNPGRGLGVKSHLSGHLQTPKVGLAPQLGMKQKYASGGIMRYDDGGAIPAFGQPGDGTAPAQDIMNVNSSGYPTIPLQDAMSSPSDSGIPDANMQSDPIGGTSLGDPSMPASVQSDPIGGTSLGNIPDAQGGFGGWLQNKHGGITGNQWLKAGLTALTGILSGIASKHGNQARISPNAGSVGIFARGGVVRMADGGMPPQQPMQGPPQQGQGQQSPQDQMIVANAMKAILGQSQNPQADIQAFVQRFGQEALQKLVEMVKQGAGSEQQQQPQQPGMASGGILHGPGSGMSDSIPAQMPNGGPAALSSGEYVVPADAVSQLGDGSSEAGAKKLDAGIAALRHHKYGRAMQPKKLHPSSNPILGQR